MRLTTFTDYSLRVLIFLAAQPKDRATIAQIANAFQVSENHLVKVVHFLGKQGWLSNVRGKGGGLELGMPPEAMVVGSVVRETEGMNQLAECFGQTDGDCAIAPDCRLRGILGEAIEAFYEVLDRYTLADLVNNRHKLAQVLFVDRDAAVRKARRAPTAP
ncbi:MAG TPA: Rrf2 family transcriptional regulator [Ramlibacter sp.]|uniref:Rrf2 family transcriptional regulator n=1 Tax=Ramlibacter sp. TaxID=1917967 RepID=UPI002D7F5942|nr:Rrf2 family transcriptional regulator [Ramlibacter sp.]HET8748898.1 Rrf2 family transcriptional regulator [Ramlibacter sp.]